MIYLDYFGLRHDNNFYEKYFLALGVEHLLEILRFGILLSTHLPESNFCIN